MTPARPRAARLEALGVPLVSDAAGDLRCPHCGGRIDGLRGPFARSGRGVTPPPLTAFLSVDDIVDPAAEWLCVTDVHAYMTHTMGAAAPALETVRAWSRPSWRARFKHRPAAHAMAPRKVPRIGPRWRRSRIAAYALVFGEVHGARGADTDRLYRDAGRADIEACHAIADAIAKAAAVKAAMAARRAVTKETKP